MSKKKRFSKKQRGGNFFRKALYFLQFLIPILILLSISVVLNIKQVSALSNKLVLLSIVIAELFLLFLYLKVLLKFEKGKNEENSFKKDDKNEFLRLLEVENELLNSRTNIFMVLNGIWIAAAKIGQTSNNIPDWLTMIGIIFAYFWVTSSFQSLEAIKQITRGFPDEFKPRIWKIKDRGLLFKGVGRPTDIMAGWLPFITLGIWIYLTIEHS